jgi:hypothetical protein
MFGNKPSIKYVYLFGAKCYVYIPEEKQIGTSKLSPRGIKYYVVDYTESSKNLRIYDPHKHPVFTFRDVVFSDSIKYLESTEIESLSDRPFDLDPDAPWTIEQKRDFWKSIVNHLNDAIDPAKK